MSATSPTNPSFFCFRRCVFIFLSLKGPQTQIQYLRLWFKRLTASIIGMKRDFLAVNLRGIGWLIIWQRQIKFKAQVKRGHWEREVLSLSWKLSLSLNGRKCLFYVQHVAAITDGTPASHFQKAERCSLHWAVALDHENKWNLGEMQIPQGHRGKLYTLVCLPVRWVRFTTEIWSLLLYGTGCGKQYKVIWCHAL